MSTEQSLSDLMDFGRIIVVESGKAEALDYDDRIIAAFDLNVEEVQYVDLDSDGGAPDPIAPAGWEYLTGFTGQYSYSGPIMHPSEYIGGRLAEHILSTPGYYVAVMIDGLVDDVDGEDTESVGWGILHYVGS